MTGRPYLKEIYKFRRQGRYYGLDVRDLRFFRMNKMAWEVFDTFPEHQKLSSAYTERDLEKLVHLLVKRNLISHTPQGIGDRDREKEPGTGFDSLALYLDKPAGEGAMPEPVWRSALDYLLGQPGKNREFNIQFITVAPEKNLETLTQAVNYAKTKNKQAAFSLRTGAFPLSPEAVEFAGVRGLVVETLPGPAICDELVAHGRAGGKGIGEIAEIFGPIAKNTVVTLEPHPGVLDSLDIILDNLWEAGFTMIHLDLLCPFCSGRRGDPLPYSGNFEKNTGWLQPGTGQVKAQGPWRLVNIVPLVYSLLVTRKIHHGCRAGVDHMAVSPEGAIYPCLHTMNKEGFLLDHLFRSPELPPGRETFNIPVSQKGSCGTCGIRYLCGGGTPARERAKDAVYCGLMRHMAEQAIVAHETLDLKQKALIVNYYKRLRRGIPHLLPIPKEPPLVKGIKTLRVQGTSMRPFIKEGDRVTVRPLEREEPKTGDIVCFGNPPTCHRVIRKCRDGEGEDVWEKGDNQPVGSRIPVSEITGKVTGAWKGRRLVRLDGPGRVLLNRLIAAISLAEALSREAFRVLRKMKVKLWERN